MKFPGNHRDINKLSFAGALVTLGIVFGDLGTSPLYVMKAIVAGGRNLTSFSFMVPCHVFSGH